MTRRDVGAGFLAVDADVGAGGEARGDGYPKLAPFTSVHWTGDLPEVEVDGRFCRLLAIDGIDVGQVVEFAKANYHGIWKKRVSEDLAQVMTEMGRQPGDKVCLALEDIGSGAEFVRKDVPMTRENRQKVWLANQKGGV
jgi:hypothetical protein